MAYRVAPRALPYALLREAYTQTRQVHSFKPLDFFQKKPLHSEPAEKKQITVLSKEELKALCDKNFREALLKASKQFEQKPKTSKS
ncbi:MAG: hypothetical protein HYX48_02280 [Chlamydiales bacterium]|nr:hypothetical protein [Chlamydiales bacterium]